MLSPKPQDFSLLLEVFRGGLTRGIISKDTVVAWADDIINKTDEPEYFFIELSLSPNVNDLIEVINRDVPNTDSILVPRVLLALMYKKVVDSQNPIYKDIARLEGIVQSFGSVTRFELGRIYSLDDYDLYYSPDLEEWKAETISFLKIYEGFTLQNYEQWPEINIKVEENLAQAKIELDAINESNIAAWNKEQREQKRKKNLKKGIQLIIISTLLIVLGCWIYETSNTFFLTIALPYFLLRVGYKLWKKRRQQKLSR